MNIEQTNKHLLNLSSLLEDSQAEVVGSIGFVTTRLTNLVEKNWTLAAVDMYKRRLLVTAEELRVHAYRCHSVANELDRLSGGFNG